MKSLRYYDTPGFLKSGVLLLGFLLYLSHVKALAQTSFNRWEARPAAMPKAVASAARRGTQIVRTKAHQDSVHRIRQLRQDSLRVAAVAAQMLPLKRGIGQRIKEKQVVSEDAKYFEYLRKTVRYPEEALRAETEGRVVIRLTVDDAGKVVNATVVENTIPEGAIGRGIIVQQVSSILRQLKFEPDAGVNTEELEMNYKYE